MCRTGQCCCCISLKSTSIAIAVIHIFCGLYFLVIGFYPIDVHVYPRPKFLQDYYYFAMAILIGEGPILFVICTSLIVGVKKRMPNCLMPFLIWVWISHFILNTIFFIFTMIILLSPSTLLDSFERGLIYQYIGKCVVYYIFGAISFIVVFSLFRSMKDDKNEINKQSNE